ncbi:hypothetical protein [Lactiplantibacillus plantarum]|nr:hypothetical protein [Lactiplantibacillus plantarum]
MLLHDVFILHKIKEVAAMSTWIIILVAVAAEVCLIIGRHEGWWS